MREFRFEHKKAQLYAVENGDQNPLVMLHGGLSNHLTSISLVGSLDSDFRIIAPDLRASGKSKYAGPLNWDLLSGDVLALLDSLQIERAIIGGASTGSGVAVRFALQYPERTAALIVINPVYGRETLSESQRSTFSMMNAHGNRAPREGMKALHPLYEKLPEGVRERALAVASRFDPESVATTTRFLASGAQPFASIAELKRISVPTLLIPGNDPMHPKDVSELYAKHIPRCYVNHASPSQVAIAVLDFCKQKVRW